MQNEFRLVISSKSVNEGFARVVVSAFAAPLDPTLEELADLKTAVSEAVTNSIVHGYGDKCGKIYITGKLSDNTVKIIIRDKGRGIEDVKQAMTPLFTTGSGDRAGSRLHRDGKLLRQGHRAFCARIRHKRYPLSKKSRAKANGKRRTQQNDRGKYRPRSFYRVALYPAGEWSMRICFRRAASV